MRRDPTVANRTTRHRRLTVHALAAASLLAGGLAGCSSSSTNTTTTRPTTSATSGIQGSAASSTTSVASAVKAAAWTSNVSITVIGTSISISSDGRPSTTYWTRLAEYALPDNGIRVPTAATAHAASDPTVIIPTTVTIPAVPTWSATTTKTSLGTIGIMVSGATLFNAYEGDAGTVALSSNFFVTDSAGTKVYFVDRCNGHPTPQGEYHYHGVPTCIRGPVDGATGPSHLIGVALDGYPIYGDRDAHGALVRVSRLDACNGIYSSTPEFPHGIYHYVLPDSTTASSSIGCYHGVLTRTVSQITAGSIGCGGPSPTARVASELIQNPARATRSRR